MNIAVKKIGKSRVELNIETGKDIVKQKYEEVYANISKEAKIPGFRQGKAPRDIIEKKFSDTARSTVIQGLVEDLYKQAIQQQDLFVINHPSISDVDLKNDRFSFTAVVEIKPDVEIKQYKGIKIKREKLEITDGKVKEALENIKKEKNAQEINDDFAKSLGYPSLTNLEEVVRNQLFLSMSENSRRRHEAQLTEFLINNSGLELPQSLIEREHKERLNMLDYQLTRQGISKTEIEAKKKQMHEAMREAAIKDIKIYFILDKVANLENIKIDQKQGTAKVMEFLLKEANWVD